MPLINEPFHRVKQGVQSTQGHRPRMSGLDGGLCVPSDAETLVEKKTCVKKVFKNQNVGNKKKSARYQGAPVCSNPFAASLMLHEKLVGLMH